MMLNFFGEDRAMKLWDNFGNVYELNFLVNNLFNLIVEDVDTLGNHINVFSILMSELHSISSRMEDEDTHNILLCSLLRYWDNLVVEISIGS